MLPHRCGFLSSKNESFGTFYHKDNIEYDENTFYKLDLSARCSVDMYSM